MERVVVGFIGILFLIAAGQLRAEGTSERTDISERPNILLIVAEDMSSHIGAFGDSLANTPNIDQLAAQGIRYTYAALKWLADNADALGVDASRIAVMGESAGGGLAAMLTLMARDRNEVNIVQQVLVYPMLDDRTGSSKPMPYWMGAYSWNDAANRFGWSSLLGVPAGSKQVPEGSVPARQGNLRGVPPTFIAVGSVDLFVNEDIDYAQRLINAGVPTELLVLPGGYHGFQRSNPEAILSQRFEGAIDAAITRAFNPPQAPESPKGFSLSTPIGELLLDARSKSVLKKYLPEVTEGSAVQMLLGISLEKLAVMAPDKFSDGLIEKIEGALRGLQ